MRSFFAIFWTPILAVRLIDEDQLWHRLEAEWIETDIEIKDSKSNEVLAVLNGKYGSHSSKKQISGYLVPLPSLTRQNGLIGKGCEKFPAFKLLKWKAKAYRKRGLTSILFVRILATAFL